MQDNAFCQEESNPEQSTYILAFCTFGDPRAPYAAGSGHHANATLDCVPASSADPLFTCMALLVRILTVLRQEHESAVSVPVLSLFQSGICFVDSPGPEEEKLLGSILLPSYKISPCSTEDRVYRKFAFKAEHTNMRTYYFAADTRELMVQWMNALSLASILQEGSRYSNNDDDSIICVVIMTVGTVTMIMTV